MKLPQALADLGHVAVLAIMVGVQQPGVDERSAAMFLRDLQRGVARDDRAAVAALIRYPLTIQAGGVRIPMADTAALLQGYDVVFSPALKALIADAAIPVRGRQAPRTPVIVTAHLMTIGPDAVRIEPLGGELRITKITMPVAAPSPESGVAVGRRPARAPERLVLDVGEIRRAGALDSGERDVYLLSAKKNRLLEVRITGVNGRDIVARIVRVTGSAPVDQRARDGARTWIGRLPDDGDYRIEVVRLAPGGASRLPYVIVVGMR
jgi:hypothetical protein